ncbi:MAG: hypothetical protein ACI90V_010614 [Bacillariaceae sp.]|jgi:hypothetical protein
MLMQQLQHTGPFCTSSIERGENNRGSKEGK